MKWEAGEIVSQSLIILFAMSLSRLSPLTMARRKKKTGRQTNSKDTSPDRSSASRTQQKNGTQPNGSAALQKAQTTEALKKITIPYSFLQYIRRVCGIEPKATLDLPDQGTDTTTLKDDGPSNISRDLIAGKTPAVGRSDSGWGLKYVSLVRRPGDRKKPELIRVLIVHPDTGDKPLECSIKVALLPHSANYRNSKEQNAEDKDYEGI